MAIKQTIEYMFLRQNKKGTYGRFRVSDKIISILSPFRHQLVALAAADGAEIPTLSRYFLVACVTLKYQNKFI